MCECGLYKKCAREIHASERGTLYVKNIEHFSCGKVQAQIKKLLKVTNISQIKFNRRK